MKQSISRYKARLIKQLGFADPEMLRRYAEARISHKLDKAGKSGKFNPYTDDPNCKTCKKAKGQAK